MATPTPNAMNTEAPKRTVSFVKNAIKNKHGFIQFFAMTGILLLSVRSLGQKYRIHGLQEDTAALHDENLSLSNRIAKLKSDLLSEDPSASFASRVSLLFKATDN